MTDDDDWFREKFPGPIYRSAVTGPFGTDGGADVWASNSDSGTPATTIKEALARTWDVSASQVRLGQLYERGFVGLEELTDEVVGAGFSIIRLTGKIKQTDLRVLRKFLRRAFDYTRDDEYVTMLADLDRFLGSAKEPASESDVGEPFAGRSVHPWVHLLLSHADEIDAGFAPVAVARAEPSLTRAVDRLQKQLQGYSPTGPPEETEWSRWFHDAGVGTDEVTIFLTMRVPDSAVPISRGTATEVEVSIDPRNLSAGESDDRVWCAFKTALLFLIERHGIANPPPVRPAQTAEDRDDQADPDMDRHYRSQTLCPRCGAIATIEGRRRVRVLSVRFDDKDPQRDPTVRVSALTDEFECSTCGLSVNTYSDIDRAGVPGEFEVAGDVSEIF